MSKKTHIRRLSKPGMTVCGICIEVGVDIVTNPKEATCKRCIYSYFP